MPNMPGICQGRLSSSSTDPMSTSGLSSSLYLVPYTGNLVSVYFASPVAPFSAGWYMVPILSTSLALGSLANGMHDVYVRATTNDPTTATATLTSTVWSTVTTPPTRTFQDGCRVSSPGLALFVGVVYVESGVVRMDSLHKWILNYFNRVQIVVRGTPNTSTISNLIQSTTLGYIDIV